MIKIHVEFSSPRSRPWDKDLSTSSLFGRWSQRTLVEWRSETDGKEASKGELSNQLSLWHLRLNSHGQLLMTVKNTNLTVTPSVRWGRQDFLTDRIKFKIWFIYFFHSYISPFSSRNVLLEADASWGECCAGEVCINKTYGWQPSLFLKSRFHLFPQQNTQKNCSYGAKPTGLNYLPLWGNPLGTIMF